jgi:hypothetical protein
LYGNRRYNYLFQNFLEPDQPVAGRDEVMAQINSLRRKRKKGSGDGRSLFGKPPTVMAI